MAIFKFVSVLHPTKNHRASNLSNCLDYTRNDEKTKEGILTGALNCRLEHAAEDMLDTMRAYGKLNLNNTRSRLAYHCVISFKKGENISNETAIKIAREFVERYLSSYECVYSAHTDKEHIHCHIVFNAVSFLSGIKYRYNDGDWAKSIQPLLDTICRENHLPTLYDDTGISIEQYDNDRKSKKRRQPKESDCNSKKYIPPEKTEQSGYDRNSMIKNDIDDAISLSKTFDEFMAVLKKRGYMIKQGNVKHMAVKEPGAGAYRRLHQLDKEGFYTEESIKKRIADNKIKAVETEKRFIVPDSYRFIPSADIAGIKKIYYAQIFRLGTVPQYYHVSYSEVRKNMKKIDLIRKKLSIITELQEDIPKKLSMKTEQLENSYKIIERRLEENRTKNYKLRKKIRNYEKTDDAEYLQKLKEELKALLADSKALRNELRNINDYRKTLYSIMDDLHEDDADYDETIKEMEEEKQKAEREEKNEYNRKAGKKRNI